MTDTLLALLWFKLIIDLPLTGLKVFIVRFCFLALFTAGLLVFRAKKVKAKGTSRYKKIDAAETKAIFKVMEEKKIVSTGKEDIKNSFDKASIEIQLRIIRSILMLIYLENDLEGVKNDDE